MVCTFCILRVFEENFESCNSERHTRWKTTQIPVLMYHFCTFVGSEKSLFANYLDLLANSKVCVSSSLNWVENYKNIFGLIFIVRLFFFMFHTTDIPFCLLWLILSTLYTVYQTLWHSWQWAHHFRWSRMFLVHFFTFNFF